MSTKSQRIKSLVKEKRNTRYLRMVNIRNKIRESHFEKIRDIALKSFKQDVLVNENRTSSRIESSLTQKISPSDKFILNRIQSKQKKYLSGYISDHMVNPDYMIGIPSNLSNEWYAYVRPEGPRVILVAGEGKCCVYSKSGCFIGSFQSALPEIGCTILDAVIVSEDNILEWKQSNPNDTFSDNSDSFSKHMHVFDNIESKHIDNTLLFKTNSILVVCDAIVWGECCMGYLSAECRYYMLKSKFEELTYLIGKISKNNSKVLKLVDYLEATATNIQFLYETSNNKYISDSIVFVHRDAPYLPELSSMYLRWKDSSISRYVVDTNFSNCLSEFQIVTLKLRLENGLLVTEDHKIVGKMLLSEMKTQLESLSPTIYLRKWRKGYLNDWLLVRVAVDGINIDLVNKLNSNEDTSDSKVKHKSIFSGYTIIGTPSPNRNKVDTLNKIIFQYIVRNKNSSNHLKKCSAIKGITLQNLLNASITGSSYSPLFALPKNSIEDFVEIENTIKNDYDDSISDETEDWMGW